MIDYLIIGQGIAGSVLAWQILNRGKTCHVIDPNLPHTASKIAGGILDPIAGQRYFQAWHADHTFLHALYFYKNIQKQIQMGSLSKIEEPFLTPKPTRRFFSSPLEKAQWSARQISPQISQHFPSPPQIVSLPGLIPKQETVLTPTTHHINTRLFLDQTQRHLISLNCFTQATIDPTALPKWLPTAKNTLWCQGHLASTHPYFNTLRFNHSKGNLLTLHCPDIAQTEILHRGKWMLPIGHHQFIAGSTFDSQNLTLIPDLDAKKAILDGLSPWVTAPITVINHHAGIRPISIDNKPIIGPHPLHADHSIFNALGSRGLTLAPYFAQHLLDHLETGSKLLPDIQITRKALHSKASKNTQPR